ncbi:MAG: nucleoside-diphosphate-sugar epimerase [Burkholderiales bacterium]|nr:nucleoside-diphosphate-sugar epimerase [Burkholderiales bacterium]
MTDYENTLSALRERPRTWVVTGVAGFIGSNLLEALLRLNQKVVGLDNFSSGHRHNLAQVKDAVTREQWGLFRLMAEDVCSVDACRQACSAAHFVLHHAALGSVPRSMEDPAAAHHSNATGFLNMLVAARGAEVERFVYASSSAVYGDHPAEVKTETDVGRLLSPYAATKYINEIYADTFVRCYGLSSIGLRYFNVFGPRQDPEGAYAAVIPQWLASMIRGEPAFINGDGETARDFCYIDDVVQANLLAATVGSPDAVNQVYNIAVGGRTTLNELFAMIRSLLEALYPHLRDLQPVYRDFRAGDVRLSQADITKARALLGYQPQWRVKAGLAEAIDWYVANFVPARSDDSVVASRQAAFS